jgi:hypothetical protein
VAGEACCEQGVLNSCGPRRVKNRAFETYVATGKTVGTVYMCTDINIYMNVNRKLYMCIYIYKYINAYVCLIYIYIYTYTIYICMISVYIEIKYPYLPYLPYQPSQPANPANHPTQPTRTPRQPSQHVSRGGGSFSYPAKWRKTGGLRP